MFHTWYWGPGERSLRRMTDGSDAAGDPWRALQVVYWHPGRQQVCLLGLDPFADGVTEGTIQFEGETASGVFDLDQTGGRRSMGLRWVFDGPDEYRETLLEASGAAGLTPLVEWRHVRSKPRIGPRPRSAEVEPNPSEHLKVLESLLGHTWESRDNESSGNAFHTESTLERIPLIEAIYARVLQRSENGGPRHLLDAYLFHHTGTNALRCLALSDRGGVYEGDLTVLDGGALQLDLKGHEGNLVAPHVVQFDFEQDGRCASASGRSKAPNGRSCSTSSTRSARRSRADPRDPGPAAGARADVSRARGPGPRALRRRSARPAPRPAVRLRCRSGGRNGDGSRSRRPGSLGRTDPPRHARTAR